MVRQTQMAVDGSIGTNIYTC